MPNFTEISRVLRFTIKPNGKGDIKFTKPGITSHIESKYRDILFNLSLNDRGDKRPDWIEASIYKPRRFKNGNPAFPVDPKEIPTPPEDGKLQTYQTDPASTNIGRYKGLGYPTP